MMKIVLHVDLHCEAMKTKAMKAVSKIPGIQSVSVDMKDKKLTVTGYIDPVSVVDKLKKVCNHEIISVGPATEPEKKKEEAKKEDKAKKEDDKKKELDAEKFVVVSYSEFCQSQMRHPYCCRSYVEEDPNSCVIC